MRTASILSLSSASCFLWWWLHPQIPLLQSRATWYPVVHGKGNRSFSVGRVLRVSPGCLGPQWGCCSPAVVDSWTMHLPVADGEWGLSHLICSPAAAVTWDHHGQGKSWKPPIASGSVSCRDAWLKPRDSDRLVHGHTSLETRRVPGTPEFQFSFLCWHPQCFQRGENFYFLIKRVLESISCGIHPKGPSVTLLFCSLWWCMKVTTL